MSSSLSKAAARTALAFALALPVAALVAVMLASPARAATFTVNESGDAVDADTTNDTCDTDTGTAGNQCTLRAAIQEANDTAGATAGEDTINFSVSTVTLTIGGLGEEAAATGDLDITESVTINGGGVVIGTDLATFDDRVFHVLSPAQATVSDATVQGGRECDGGGFFVESGATLDLDGSTLTDNQPCDEGGGIFNDGGTLTVTDSTFTENFADFLGGGILNDDGGTLTVTGSTFDGNQAADAGGGIFNDGGTLTVTDSTFDGNQTEGDGGGILNEGTLTLTGSTFTENIADSTQGGFGSGGGLAVVFGGDATVTNSTFSGNTTLGESDNESSSGGGVAVIEESTLSLTNVTIADNEAPNSFGGGIANTTGSASAVQAKNTIVANNTQAQNGQCGTSETTSGGVTSQGGNLEFPGTSCGFEVNADPKLLALTDNGGPTETRALDDGSAAIDAGTSDCPPPATDQRGETRPTDGDGDGFAFCDSGAFEREADATPDPIVVSIDDPQVTEGSGGFNSITFTVTLSRAAARPIEVDYETQNGTATAGSDYAATSGTLNFAPGQTSKQITVQIGTDTKNEPNETFEVTLDAPGKTTPVTDEGVGTIEDDDAPPTLFIGNAQVTEGNSGTKSAVFTVTRLGDTSGPSSVSYATQNGTATAPGDYTATSGTLNFAAGQTGKQVSVAVKGDSTAESDEIFNVNLSNASAGTVIGDGQGTGTILDDDGSGGGGDTTKPTVVLTKPSQGATGIALNSTVVAGFSEQMDPSTINNSTFRLFKKDGDARIRVPAQVTYDAAKKRAFLNPNGNLAPGTEYIASVTTGAKDLAGNGLLDQNPNRPGDQFRYFSFTTRS